MNTIFFTLIFQAIRRIITAELFAVILKLVIAQTSSDLKGPEKKAAVMIELYSLQGVLGDSVKGFASWVLSMAVDIAVAEIKKQQAKFL